MEKQNRISWNLYKILSENKDEDDEKDFDLEDNAKGKVLKFPNEHISTPIGDIPSLDGWSPLRDRNFYIADVNFVLTDQHIKLISIVLGVEHIHALSPYSFSIIIGRLFNEEDVINKIESSLDVNRNLDIDTSDYIDDNSPLYDLVSPILNKLVDNKYWILYIFPNGRVLEKVYETEEEFDSGVESFQSDKDNENFEDYSEGIYFDSQKKLE